jgi:hypothetical protein
MISTLIDQEAVKVCLKTVSPKVDKWFAKYMQVTRMHATEMGRTVSRLDFDRADFTAGYHAALIEVAREMKAMSETNEVVR